MKYARLSRWGALRWILPLAAGIFFVGGLVYAHIISQENSRKLTLIREQTYPFLEKTGFLKFDLKSIQAGFYYAVTQSDSREFQRVKNQEEEFLAAFDEIEALIGDKERVQSIRDLSKEYLSVAEEFSRLMIETPGNIAQAQSLIIQASEKGRLLTEAIERMNREGIENFKKALVQSEENSSLSLKVSLISVIFGMVLVGSFFSWILVLNHKLLSANEHLEDEVKYRTQDLESVVYTISHDLKSPVVSMQGMASVFMEEYGPRVDDKGRHYIDRILANGNYMEELIRDILALSRVGKPKNPEWVNAKELLEKILEVHGPLLAEKKVKTIVRENFPQALFERSQLTELFQNLITNAVKFMGDQPFPVVEIGGKELEEGVEFYVKDNGIGIDPAYHDKIFGLFQRLHEVEVEGTGVGLAIVKKIVDLAGGKIWIESRKGEGTTFFIRLPRRKDAK